MIRVAFIGATDCLSEEYRVPLQEAGYLVSACTFESLAEVDPIGCSGVWIVDARGSQADAAERLMRKIRAASCPHLATMVVLEADDPRITEWMLLGPDDFITAPINPAIIAWRVRQALRVRSLRVEIRRLHGEMERQVTSDHLTGLANRETFFAILRHEWARSMRTGRNLSVVMIDIDDFKSVNDTYGHLIGDAALQCAASCLVSTGRSSDVMARLGGDEFAAVLPETDHNGALVWAERAREKIAISRVDCLGQSVHVSASFGVATRTEKENSPEELVHIADRLLYSAKNSGKNRVLGLAHGMGTREAASVVR